MAANWWEGERLPRGPALLAVLCISLMIWGCGWFLIWALSRLLIEALGSG
jgi:hypothetical protein